jgi:thiazole/oxazole-forming peptide maturase SagD family component
MGKIVAELVTLEIAKWASGNRQPVPVIIELDAATLDSSRHAVHWRPQCSLCGNPTLQAERMARPLSLNDTEESRIEKFSEVSFLVDEMTGGVSSVMPTATLPSGMHAYYATFGFGREARDFFALKRSFLSQAAGMGQTEESAKIGAVCEAVERYSGMWHGDEGNLVASYDRIDPMVRIHPNDCMLYSESQYARRREINAKGMSFDFVPEPFEETLPIQWTGAWSLTSKRFKLLPSSYLFYNLLQPVDSPFCWADSNGCAAGASQTDAVRRGIYELIERDSVAIWWYNRVRRPEIDLHSFRSEYFDAFVASYEQVDRRVYVLDVTGDLKIPTCVAVSVSKRDGPQDILMSFGSHVDIRQAIERALFEMNHLLPAVLQCNREPNGDYPYPDESSKQWWRTATLANQPYLVPLDDVRKMTAADYDDCWKCNVSAPAQARYLVRNLADRGYEVLTLDQTRPDIGIHVVRTIVPGLRHFWTRFAPGRLFEVPVSLGWLPKPLTEQDLNPISMFL